MNNKTLVKVLYRNKLRICNRLGYQYGNWNNNYITNNITYKKIHKHHTKKLAGNYLMNNIRDAYKSCSDEVDDEIINHYIVDGFESLRELNELEFCYKKKRKV